MAKQKGPVLFSLLPPDVLRHHILPCLDVFSLVSLGHCSRPHHSLVRDGCEVLWRDHHDRRWATSLSPPRRPRVGAGDVPDGVAAVSSWRGEYERRHRRDALMGGELRSLARGDAGADLWPRLLLDGRDVYDRVRELCSDGGDDDVRVRDVARELIVGINRLDVFRAWRELILLDRVRGDGGARIEDGAVLLARLYLTADRLLEIPSLDSFEMDISGRIDILAQELRRRLAGKRLDNADGRGGDEAGAGVVSLEPYPLRMVLEEMRGFFLNPEEQGHSEGGDTVDDAAGCRTRFFGNVNDYYNHRNSLLDHLLRCGLGIPITLSVLYAAIIRRAMGLGLHGVGLAGHFLLGVPQQHQDCGRTSAIPNTFIDAFHGGRILSVDDCASIVQRYGLSWDDDMAQPVRTEEIWGRMVRSLANCHMIELRMTGGGILRSDVAAAGRMMNVLMILASDEILTLADGMDLARQDALHRIFCR